MTTKTVDTRSVAERLIALQILAYRHHPHRVDLMEAAYETAIEAIEAHDFGQFPENLKKTVANFKAEFECRRGERAYVYCLAVAQQYGGGRRS